MSFWEIDNFLLLIANSNFVNHLYLTFVHLVFYAAFWLE